MASNKNRNTFRASNVSNDTTEEQFEAELLKYFTEQEKKDIKIAQLSFAPSCIDSGNTQTAIVKFEPKTPIFLNEPDKQTFHMLLNGEEIEIDQEFFGLTQLYPPEEKITLDIVAMTGLNGHAYGSWTGDTGKMWLHHFFSKDDKLRHCRTMIFGYNSKLQIPSIHTTHDYVQSLLTELMIARGSKEVWLDYMQKYKDMEYTLTFEQGKEKANSFYRPQLGRHHCCECPYWGATHSILFFGVPHRGIFLDDVANMVKEQPQNQGYSLVDNVIYEAKMITPNTSHFVEIVSSKKMKILSFYETQKTPKVAKQENGRFGRTGEYVMVVSQSSALLGLSLDLEVPHAVEGNHSTMVKFTNTTNRTYQTVRNYLRSYDEEVWNMVPETSENPQKNYAEGKLIENWVGSTTLDNWNDVLSQSLRLAADVGLFSHASRCLTDGADPNFQNLDSRIKDHRWFFDIELANSQRTFSGDKWQLQVSKVLESRETALSLAAKRGHSEIVELLLQSKANPNLGCPTSHRTPLHEACSEGHPQVVQLLLSKGASPNAKDLLWHTTPLHDLARNGHMFVDILVRFQVDLNAQLLYSKDTPLHIAARAGRSGVVHHLYSNGANVAVQNSRGYTALHEAARNGHRAVVSILLQRDKDRKDIDTSSKLGATALHEAAQMGHVEVVETLLDMGADPTAMTRSQKTAADLAEKKSHQEVKELLERYTQARVMQGIV